MKSQNKLFIMIIILFLFSSFISVLYVIDHAHDIEEVTNLISNLVITNIFAVFINIILLKLFVFDKLKIVNNNMKIINEENDIGKRITKEDRNNDEIEEIIERINFLLSEFQKKESRLNEVLNLYVSLVEDAPILVMRLNPDGEIIFLNNTAERYFKNYPDFEIGGNVFHSFRKVSKEIKEDYKRSFSKINSSNPTINELRSLPFNPHKEDNECILYENTRGIFNQYGEVKEYQIVATDISKEIKARNKLNKNLVFQSLVSESIDLLVASEEKNISEAIYDVLKKILNFFEVDRSYLFLKDGKYIRNTHEVCSENITLQKDNLNKKDLLIKDFPILFKKLSNLEHVAYSDVNTIESEKLKKDLEMQNIRSILVLPVSYNHTLLGFIGLDSVNKKKHWSKEEVQLLYILGRTMGVIFKSFSKKKLNEFVKIEIEEEE